MPQRFTNRRVLHGENMEFHPVQVFDQYISYAKDVKHLAPDTLKNRRCYMLKLIEALNCNDIRTVTIKQVDGFLASYSGYERETVNTVIRIVRAYFAFAQRYLQIPLQFDYALVKELRSQNKQINTFTPEQIRRVIHLAENKQDRLMIAVLFEAGLRISELVSLKVEDIAGTRLQVCGKGNRTRLTFITPNLARNISAHLLEKGIYTGPVFRHNQKHKNVHKDYFHPDTVRQRLKKAFKRAGLDMRPHQLRHSFATDLLGEGADIRSVQKLLGHSNINTTMRYLQVTDNYLEESFQRYRPLSVVI